MATKKYERWKEIPGYNGIYLVSDQGRVRVRECLRYLSNGRTICTKARFIGSNPKQGYPWVLLCHPKTRKRTCAIIHILVAEAFLGPRPSPKHQLNHIDGNKQNPAVSNVEWVTASENCLHALQTGLRKKGVFVEYNGECLRLTTWARKLNIPQQTLFARYRSGYVGKELFSSGLTAERIKKLSATKKANAPKYKDGLSALEWAALLGISRGAFLWRIKRYDKEKLVYKQGTYPRVGPGSGS